MLLFSDSKGHALMAYIVKCHQDLDGKRKKYIIGRTHMQKIPYVLKAIGVPVPFSFRIHLYGPYSQDITFALDDMLADEVIDDVSPDKKRCSNFVIGNNAEDLIAKYGDYFVNYKNRIEKVVDAFSSFDSKQLELFTTLHYTYLEKKASSNDLPSKHEVIEAFKEVKKDKFSQKDIAEMLDLMIEINFIKVRASLKSSSGK